MKLPSSLTTVTPLSKLIVLILFILLPVIGFILGIQYEKTITASTENYIQNVTTTPSVSPTVALVKNMRLLRSRNNEEVIKGMASEFIPLNQIKIEASLAALPVPFYRVDLNDRDYETLRSYFGFTEFSFTKSLTFNTSNWIAFGYTDASDVYIKDNYECIFVTPNGYGIPISFGCAKAGDLENNTKENVSNFIYKLFTEASIPCDTNTCPLLEEKNEIPFDMYSKKLLYFDERFKNPTAQEIEKVKEDIAHSANLLKNNGWSTTLEDYTETERKWSSDTFTSQRFIAENNDMRCSHTITITKLYGKRHIIECTYKIEALLQQQKEIDRILGF